MNVFAKQEMSEGNKSPSNRVIQPIEPKIAIHH